jgi:hypothetical protein
VTISACLPVATVFQAIDGAVNFLTDPKILFPLSAVLLVASMKFARVWTRPPVALAIAAGAVLLFVYSLLDWEGVSHEQFRLSVGKADNVPIVLIIGMLFFFYWLAMRKAVLNDERIANGQPPLEAAEKSRKVLVWPDLVYTELISMVVVSVVLIVWSIYLKAPIEEPANAARTPNPSKAPWYFLGLQELLVYFDPWLAGVAIPALIMVGLIAIPYVDRNPKGNGYFTLSERRGAIFVFLLGFFVLWVVNVFIGTFLRGPGWNFFGLYENWDPSKQPYLGNVDVSELVWVRLFGMTAVPENVLLRELPGILIVLGYMTILPLAFAATVGKKLFRELGAIRFGVVVNLGLVMLALPLKMLFRWLVNLKYVVNTSDVDWLKLSI